MSSLLACVAGCNKPFSDSSKLSKHQSSCRFVIATREKANIERKARGLGSLLPKVPLKSTLRKERLQMQVAKESLVQKPNALVFSESVSEPSTLSVQEASPEPISSSSQVDERQPTPSLSLPVVASQVSRSGRPRREVRLPLRFRDYLPESATSFIDADEPAPVRRVLLIVRDRLQTTLNNFGIWREYPNRPSADPDSHLSLADLAPSPKTSNQRIAHTNPSFWPFGNFTVHSVMKWLNNGHVTKSEAELTKLVKDTILSPSFRVHHLLGFDAHTENQRLDREIIRSELHSNFTERPIHIDVPSGQAGKSPVSCTVPGFLYRSIVTVIKEAFTGSLAHLLHYSPFRLYYHNPDSGKDERVFGEIYTSDAFLAESDKVRYKSPADPADPTCTREKVVAALMFSSDATHLADFGTAKAWPIYLMLGNLTKYVRSQPDSGAMHHLAYVPSLPESFKEFVEGFHPKWRTQKAQILAHCKRELMQEVWKTLLDDNFIHAYKYGIVVKCIDGVERRIFPRLFTYSADYPEKVLLATIRDKGACPCPRCLVKSKDLDQLGMEEDTSIRHSHRTYNVTKVQRARDLIYKKAKPITGANVEALLKEHSFVPTMNAFVNRLGPDYDPFEMLVVNLLHEFELGVWKALFSHLIRILYAAGSGSDKYVIELDCRFAAISPFGRGTIRKFAANSSEMKKMAARDFEDLLQCSIPAFEGLLEEPHNQRVIKLLYRTAEWHALAKLRMQTEQSVHLLQDLTTEFGTLIRHFRDTTCVDFQTIELPKEAAARARHKAAPMGEQLPVKSATSLKRQPKGLNLQTVKMHFLGDYTNCIRVFGTTDSYSTQLGEVQHRIVKYFYALTNKRDAPVQIGQKYIRKEVLRSEEEQEINATTNLEGRFSISESRDMPVSLFELSGGNAATSVKNFIPKLQEHILCRVTSRSEGFTEEDRDSIRIRNNTIYEHFTARINYTTYDLHWDYDVINSRSRPFIMAIDPESKQHSIFWYAAVIGIFHVEFQHIGSTSKSVRPQILHFFWVHWLGPVEGHDSGRDKAMLPKIQPLPEDDEFAYGCLDPSLVVRGCHLMPAFHDGPRRQLAQNQQVQYQGRRLMTEESLSQWKNYYVGIFVDRDMFMRQLGLGLGHRAHLRSKSSLEFRPMDGVEPTTTLSSRAHKPEAERPINDMDIDEVDPNLRSCEQNLGEEQRDSDVQNLGDIYGSPGIEDEDNKDDGVAQEEDNADSCDSDDDGSVNSDYPTSESDLESLYDDF
ncbi:hypothetical protein BJ165DRAFT_1531274 [Panaeolus papilionaceus]|nr:hypothetical protein BJ165DRAFT_1531274 [Panaeolus papilionaceus]